MSGTDDIQFVADIAFKTIWRAAIAPPNALPKTLLISWNNLHRLFSLGGIDEPEIQNQCTKGAAPRDEDDDLYGFGELEHWNNHLDSPGEAEIRATVDELLLPSVAFLTRLYPGLGYDDGVPNKKFVSESEMHGYFDEIGVPINKRPAAVEGMKKRFQILEMPTSKFQRIADRGSTTDVTNPRPTYDIRVRGDWKYSLVSKDQRRGTDHEFVRKHKNLPIIMRLLAHKQRERKGKGTVAISMYELQSAISPPDGKKLERDSITTAVRRFNELWQDASRDSEGVVLDRDGDSFTLQCKLLVDERAFGTVSPEKLDKLPARDVGE